MDDFLKFNEEYKAASEVLEFLRRRMADTIGECEAEIAELVEARILPTHGVALLAELAVSAQLDVLMREYQYPSEALAALRDGHV